MSGFSHFGLFILVLVTELWHCYRLVLMSVQSVFTGDQSTGGATPWQQPLGTECGEGWTQPDLPPYIPNVHANMWWTLGVVRQSLVSNVGALRDDVTLGKRKMLSLFHSRHHPITILLRAQDQRNLKCKMKMTFHNHNLSTISISRYGDQKRKCRPWHGGFALLCGKRLSKLLILCASCFTYSHMIFHL